MREFDEHLAPVIGGAQSAEKSPIDQSIDQFDGAVVLELHALGKHADGRTKLVGEAAYCQKQLMLLRFDACLPRSVFAEAEELPNLIPKLGHCLKIWEGGSGSHKYRFPIISYSDILSPVSSCVEASLDVPGGKGNGFHQALNRLGSRGIWRSRLLEREFIWLTLANFSFKKSVSENSMKYAVIRTGGKQYRVSEGEVVKVEKLAGEIGEKVTLSDVLFVGGDGDPKIGAPLVSDAKVTGEIVDQGRAKKIIVFKKKRRKSYSRQRGHRQYQTALKITAIEP